MRLAAASKDPEKQSSAKSKSALFVVLNNKGTMASEGSDTHKNMIAYAISKSFDFIEIKNDFNKDFRLQKSIKRYFTGLNAISDFVISKLISAKAYGISPSVGPLDGQLACLSCLWGSRVERPLCHVINDGRRCEHGRASTRLRSRLAKALSGLS